MLATKDTRLSRDVAAAGVIGLFGLSGGKDYLMEQFRGIDTIRINHKGRFGRHVRGWVGCKQRQSDNCLTTQPTDEKSWLTAGALIKNIATEMAGSGKSQRAGRTMCRIVADNGVTDTPRRKKKPAKPSSTILVELHRQSSLKNHQCSSLSKVG